MNITFYKYQGTGNDFVIIDNRNGNFDSSNSKLVSFLCDRRMGIGADGLMLLEEHPDDGIDFSMVYFNSDGKEASMCGNGARCITAFAVHLNSVKDPQNIKFVAADGMHDASYDNGIVSLKMINVSSISQNEHYFFLNTGVPHYVTHQPDIESIDIAKQGALIRYSEEFAPEGTNVNFVEQLDTNHIKVRTYERGVEGETYSCGTGVVASAISTYVKDKKSHNFNIDVKGGKLQVCFEGDENKGFQNIWLIGPATFVFKGEINVVES